jgi:uncharacterized repeat protein (TIGR03803 family)
MGQSTLLSKKTGHPPGATPDANRRRVFRRFRFLAIEHAFILAIWLATAIASPAQTFKLLTRFNGTDGNDPSGWLTQATDGNLYGITVFGGANSACGNGLGCGTVFRITPAGKLTTLYSFCSQANCTDGAFPNAGLFLATNGNLYATTAYGGANTQGDGYGTVFEITPSGKLTTLYSFCSQANCADGAELLQG